MQNIKYHIINTAAVLLFSYASASTINQAVKYSLAPDYSPQNGRASGPGAKRQAERKSGQEELVGAIVGSGFFRMGGDNTSPDAAGAPAPGESIDRLTLMGTITGPWSIARALIKKDGEREPVIFALYRVNSEITSDVYGYKLVRIDTDRVSLEQNGKREVLELFAKKELKKSQPGGSEGPPADGGRIKKTMSRAEIRQNVMNNLDEAMKGIVAGPYRRNGVIEGYELKTVRPYNILYKLGIRNGDIIKRVNGKELNSTEKLYSMWQTMQSENRISVDLERGGRMMTFDLNVTE